jgi:hypothetical protein
MDLAKLCDQVFALDDDIRYAGVIDDTGALIAGGMREGIYSITDQSNEELYLAQTALRKSMRERFDTALGKARFAYVERDKISILTFYMSGHTLVVTIEPNVGSHTAMDIAKDTLDLLNGGGSNSSSSNNPNSSTNIINNNTTVPQASEQNHT